MERREFVKTVAGATAVAMTAKVAMAGSHKGHKGHDHGSMGKVVIPSSGFKSRNLRKVADTARECAASAKICISHCTQEFAKGNKMLAACQAITVNTMAICEALEMVTTMDSLPKAELTAFVESCSDICELCAKECKKHKKHDECLECAKACEACIKACQRLVS